jgi:hypothetical protein
LWEDRPVVDQVVAAGRLTDDVSIGLLATTFPDEAVVAVASAGASA